MYITNATSFLLAWLRDPRAISAITPSGRRISALITQGIGTTTGPVMELGPGTGSFTYSLLERGVRESDLTLVELNADFAELLQKRFPKARVLRLDATRIGMTDLFKGTSFGAVVSGLGFRAMRSREIRAILGEAFKNLRPGGAFHQITYGRHCPVPDQVLGHLKLREARIGGTIWNLPPASVYRISRAADCKVPKHPEPTGLQPA
ncbi:class I SAM-dependent methyltransferase (plasmid) [Rhizobium sp. WW22]|uniref:class I SAM-dependent methyltransferase n=1 Tax=unclassified Rhizobium TaxID=2613769 RepID=UPI000DD8833A|nr:MULTISPECIES: methyltransferase domain-containing protein [unclassified Rhizobium]MBB3384126.1 phospholipid N-methyltransferase [Rhizobium sp. BK098]MBB3615827.1 phospholipid N-methyltransferase [Rhizobium sp. BK609]MBB3681486.1 phospholipid N-methyltransferase [Rhizobium sp. BK612]